MSRRPVRIANCSGFYGDRLSAAREMVDGGSIDVLTGDWLAELTMLLLARTRLKRGPGSGYARTFLTQMEQVLGTCLDRGIRVVSNAGGLDPQGCADALRELADRLGLAPRIGVVTGDDLMPRLDELRAAGEELVNLDTGEKLAEVGAAPLTANAYLGGFGVAAALGAGADVVVTGRVTDAALVVGPAAWWHMWSPMRLDELAGAVVAGHAIECGAQVTGGNYAFFSEVPGLSHVGFPIAEVADDGSSVITKHEGTGGLVDVGTVTAQLLYEIAGPAYVNPDVVARFDSIRLDQVGANRVRVMEVTGHPPPDRLKVAINYLGGYRNTMTLVLTGLDVPAKAALAERTLRGDLPEVEHLEVELISAPVADDPATTAQAQAHLRVTARDRDPAKVGRSFASVLVEIGLACYPGYFATTMPSEAAPYGVYWPTTIATDLVQQQVTIDGRPVPLPAGNVDAGRVRTVAQPRQRPHSRRKWGATVRAPLGRVVGARSGDKGGNANVGVWARDDPAYEWLHTLLTVDRFHDLLPETRPHRTERFELPNLRALNFVVHGLLGRGVAENALLDPQAKGLSELLRARVVDVPADLLP
ncbi:MAG: acyclic terpene utilization AtuA family protein [Candidatus Nanopelagicales bacterium]